MGFQRLHDLLHGPHSQSFLLGSAPCIRLAGPATWRGGPQIFADMIKVAEQVALLLEDFLALALDPIGPIPHSVNPAVQSPPGRSRAVPPALPRFGHVPERGRIDGGGAVFGLRRRQPHFFPLSRTLPLPWSRL